MAPPPRGAISSISDRCAEETDGSPESSCPIEAHQITLYEVKFRYGVDGGARPTAAFR